MSGIIRALGAVVVAGLDVVGATVRSSWRHATTAPDDELALERERQRAHVVGYRGPVDAGGRWLNDLVAGRVDHEGQPMAKRPCGCGKRRVADADGAP